MSSAHLQADRYDIYTRVSTFMDWMERTILENGGLEACSGYVLESSFIEDSGAGFLDGKDRFFFHLLDGPQNSFRPLHGHSPANRRLVQLRDPLNNHPARHQRPCGQLRPSRSSRAAEEPRHLCHQGSTAEAGHLWWINKSLRFQQVTCVLSIVSLICIYNCFRDTDITKLS